MKLATTRKDELMPDVSTWQMMQQQSQMLVKTGFLPSGINTPEQATAIMLKGRELGIPPMQAFSQISVIKGKPCVSPELMLALIYRGVPGCDIIFAELTTDVCLIKARRKEGQPMQEFTFSMEDAKRAQLASKDNWKKYPRAMVRSRCIAEMARSLFPDAIMGCSYTPEEMGANTNEEGEVIEVTQAQTQRAIKVVEDKPANSRLDMFKTRLIEVINNAVDNGLSIEEVFRMRTSGELIESIKEEQDCISIAQKIEDWREAKA